MSVLIGWGVFGSIVLSMYGQYLWKMGCQEMLYSDEIHLFHLLHLFTDFSDTEIAKYKGLP